MTEIQTIGVVGAGAMGRGIAQIAVSYTHLDVYKRQIGGGVGTGAIHYSAPKRAAFRPRLRRRR